MFVIWINVIFKYLFCKIFYKKLKYFLDIKVELNILSVLMIENNYVFYGWYKLNCFKCFVIYKNFYIKDI